MNPFIFLPSFRRYEYLIHITLSVKKIHYKESRYNKSRYKKSV